MAQIDLGQVVGPPGTPGANGSDGLTPTIVGGFWYIGGVNTGVKAEGTDGTNGTDGNPSTPVVSNTQTGTAYTLVLTDAGKIIVRSNAAANNTTVPPDSTANFPIGTVITVEQAGAGISSIVAGSGVTINRFGGLSTAGQYALVQLRKHAANDWRLYGGITHV